MTEGKHQKSEETLADSESERDVNIIYLLPRASSLLFLSDF